ncbi:protein kinase [Streptomyces zhihengii]
MASAYIEGPTLAQEVARRGPLDEKRLWALAAALAEALRAIHACGLVHRDLKPANIVLADDGPRVLDFGIARATEGTRMTAEHVAVGTLGFLAPEQAQGLDVTGASDVFALGAVLVAAAGDARSGTAGPMGCCTGRSTRRRTSPPYPRHSAPSWSPACESDRNCGPRPSNCSTCAPTGSTSRKRRPRSRCTRPGRQPTRSRPHRSRSHR